MSGHSKWANIKHKKGKQDEIRGKIFQKLAKEIYVAAKGGDPDPANNPSLRMVIEKAKGQNMPNERIQKAIDKAHGSSDGENYETVIYEGYGSGGIAIMVECLTDNKNRTASQVREAFKKKGGNLGTTGSVSYLFQRMGVIAIAKDFDEDEVMMTALDNGADDFAVNEDAYEIYTAPEDFIKVKEGLEALGVTEFLVSEVTLVPQSKSKVDKETYEKVMGLVEWLEDLDDVQSVYYNLEDE